MPHKRSDRFGEFDITSIHYPWVCDFLNFHRLFAWQRTDVICKKSMWLWLYCGQPRHLVWFLHLPVGWLCVVCLDHEHLQLQTKLLTKTSGFHVKHENHVCMFVTNPQPSFALCLLLIYLGERKKGKKSRHSSHCLVPTITSHSLAHIMHAVV